jgi:NAD(P)-dependent dehydrogenase (short-subunit alcohol dehydrogenase family)
VGEAAVDRDTCGQDRIGDRRQLRYRRSGCELLAERGAKVVLAARRVDELDRVAMEIKAAGGEALAVRADVTVNEDIGNVVCAAQEGFGGLDIAFNNAGSLGSTALVADQTPQAWSADITTVHTSVFLSMRNEIPAMLERGGGTIINNASQLGVVGIGAGISSYVAGKHGVIRLTKAAALEYAPRNIRVNAVALASVDTPMYRSSVGGDEQAAEMFRSLHPVGRIATAEEAALQLTLAASVPLIACAVPVVLRNRFLPRPLSPELAELGLEVQATVRSNQPGLPWWANMGNVKLTAREFVINSSVQRGIFMTEPNLLD